MRSFRNFIVTPCTTKVSLPNEYPRFLSFAMTFDFLFHLICRTLSTLRSVTGATPAIVLFAALYNCMTLEVIRAVVHIYLVEIYAPYCDTNRRPIACKTSNGLEKSGLGRNRCGTSDLTGALECSIGGFTPRHALKRNLPLTYFVTEVQIRSVCS